MEEQDDASRSLYLRSTLSDSTHAPIIVISHLDWDWVWQRPQQFMSRFARTHRVLFVETHAADVTTTGWKLRVPEGHPNITVLQIEIPGERWSDRIFTDQERRVSLQRVLANELSGEFRHPILWFYDPMAVTAYAGQMGERLIVYDCMDELSQFKGAPAGLVERERELVRRADVVFCGGRGMCEKRLPHNRNCYFYGTGVETRHFGAARSPELPVAPEIAALPGPVLGYFGVVDERIDYELLARLADARADWSVAMVGPTAKVDPQDFPRRPNLHFLGGRRYADLPAITKGFAVCLMPFALCEATEYINPTKALEYMAAGKPIVSTAINEVKANFAGVVAIARTHEEFVELCAEAVNSPPENRIARGLSLAARNSWDGIIERMERHIADALNRRLESAIVATAHASGSTVSAPRAGSAVSRT